MTIEAAKAFHEGRAIEEKHLAEEATDPVQSIPHDQLAKLHADMALAMTADMPPQETALEVAAIDGNVVLVAAGEFAFLTPNAALLTSDRLSARAFDAGHQKTPVDDSSVASAIARSS